MSMNELRAGQLLTTYGPGALIDFIGESVIIAGLEFWHYDLDKPLPVISEPRLEAQLRKRLQMPSVQLRLPPEKTDSFKEAKTNIEGFKFPSWVQVQNPIPVNPSQGVFKRRLIHKKALNKHGKYVDENGKSWPVVAVRFIQACSSGHISDIDWDYVLHQGEPCSKRTFWIEEGSSSTGLASIKVFCECGKVINLSDLFNKESNRLGPCHGNRPWLGFGTSEEGCTANKRAVVRSASNVYYPQLFTVISIPDVVDPIWAGVNSQWATLQAVTDMSVLRTFLTIPSIQQELGHFSEDKIFRVIQAKKNGEEPQQNAGMKEVEFRALSSASRGVMTQIPEGDFYAQEVSVRSSDRMNIDKYFSKIVAVHKLREVSALYGFTRLEPIARDFNGEPDPGADLTVQLAQISRSADWLPAIENHGEGIFCQFNNQEISSWKERVSEYNEELKSAFGNSSVGSNTQIGFPGIEYYLAHSVCHLLMSTLTLECGYPSSSLKERIYLGNEGLGFLIYTASQDADGTLGGLVQQSYDLAKFLEQAIENARLCSNDPLCASHRPSDPDERYLTGAACHSCLHVPETSCEQWNRFLDRNVVVETLERRGVAFFNE